LRLRGHQCRASIQIGDIKAAKQTSKARTVSATRIIAQFSHPSRASVAGIR
jgi:hypothetical protein